MHEYKRFVQEQMDARGWRQADLVRASGLSRALVSRILRDDRPRLGQMPDESTMAGIAKAFSLPTETVRTAAARALRGYADDGEALTADLSAVSIDALLMEIRRRVQGNEDQGTTHAQGDTPTDAETGTRGTPMKGADVAWLEDHRAPDVDDMLDRVTTEARRQDEADEERDEPLPYDPEQLHAARDLPGRSKGQWLREQQDRDAEVGDVDGPEEGA
ncbi:MULTISPECIES: helix-turn-helix domain-containing protein [unclassified Dietzia]|uniref:helix-turn-helix domain-containing protein n=1 Tax=unclassified Dietzia TaxID=2617939 RepID=UPI0015F90412|nr:MULTISPECIES: helix-turn-helix transcriptional regulator [unclassified Dietzia]MBB1023330.1 helix-turn-helix transcriptional regulator [Dietzia sp. DQ12-76]MBB1026491.1 helix-turn-helix transcriptional regulator [Dietzia sp. DQ11-38-2]